VDTTTLVSDLVEDGRRIIEQLTKNGFEVTAGFWLKKAEDGQWYFYIASPAAESERLSVGYGRLFTLIREMPPPHWIDPLEVRLIGPSSPLARDVLGILNRAPNPTGGPIRWGGTVLGNVSIEDAYLYRLQAPTACV
jgi:hypothetical protein